MGFSFGIAANGTSSGISGSLASGTTAFERDACSGLRFRFLDGRDADDEAWRLALAFAAAVLVFFVGGSASGGGTSFVLGGAASGGGTSFVVGGAASGGGTSFVVGGAASGSGTSFVVGGTASGSGTSFVLGGAASVGGTSSVVGGAASMGRTSFVVNFPLSRRATGSSFLSRAKSEGLGGVVRSAVPGFEGISFIMESSEGSSAPGGGLALGEHCSLPIICIPSADSGNPVCPWIPEQRSGGVGGSVAENRW